MSVLTTLRSVLTTGRSTPAREAGVEEHEGARTRRFERLYRDHADRVYGLCLRMSGDRADATELAQDVFVRAWEKLGGFRGESAFATWLHRLAVNLVLGDRRTRLRRAARETESAALAESSGAPLGRVDAGVDLERAIAELPPGARAVFVLHEIEGYRHDEIADMMDLSVGTSKAQLHRARALLRGVLA